MGAVHVLEQKKKHMNINSVNINSIKSCFVVSMLNVFVMSDSTAVVNMKLLCKYEEFGGFQKYFCTFI